MRKIIAIIAALFVGALVAASYTHGYVGDKIVAFVAVYFAVYCGLMNWRELFILLTK